MCDEKRKQQEEIHKNTVQKFRAIATIAATQIAADRKQLCVASIKWQTDRQFFLF